MPKPLFKMSKKQATTPKKAVPVAKVKAVKVVGKTATPGPTFFTQDGKPDPNGLYDKEGFMVRIPGQKSAAQQKQEKERADAEAARRAGFKK